MVKRAHNGGRRSLRRIVDILENLSSAIADWRGFYERLRGG
jgi:hypothetical protein